MMTTINQDNDERFNPFLLCMVMYIYYCIKSNLDYCEFEMYFSVFSDNLDLPKKGGSYPWGDP
jgi:hypothetical protein